MKELKEELRPRLSEYVSIVTTPSRKAGRDMYVCPLCGSGSSGRLNSDGAFHLTGDKWYCHACQRGGDIFDLYAGINGLDTKADFQKITEGLSEELGVTAADRARQDFTPEPKEQQKEKPLDPEKIGRIKEYASKLTGSPAEAYLKKRGFSDEIIKKFNLGYNPERYVWKAGKSFEALVIPYPDTDYYTERLLAPEGDVAKYQNQSGEAPTFIFRGSDSGKYFVTEGQLDALSMIQAGAENVIASHYPKKIERLIDNGFRISSAVIVADRDDAGAKIAQDLTALFSKKKIRSAVIYPPEGFKDSNDVLRKDPKKLTDILLQGMKDLEKEAAPDLGRFIPHNVADYLTDKIFEKDIEYFKQYKDRKTGFVQIDQYLTLYPGLAVLGGVSSLGKTSFSMQLADQLIRRGETVLYFAMEQQPIELVTKGLTRTLYEVDPMTHFTNIDVKNGAASAALDKAKALYAERSKELYIVNCDFNTTVEQIREYVIQFMKDHGEKRPVLFIDYLQLIAPPEDLRGKSDKEIVDHVVKSLKMFQQENELLIVCISNFNRGSYFDPVSESSFKESGMIEYCADYLWGLQLSVLEDPEIFTTTGSRGGKKEETRAKKIALLNEEKDKNPKEVEFVSIKSRNGKQFYTAFFKYYMAADLFREYPDSTYNRGKRYYPELDTPERDFNPFTESDEDLDEF